MREGLRSGVKLLAKPDKGKVSPSRKTVKVQVDRTEKDARESTFENASKLLASGTEEDKLTSAAAEEKATDVSKCHDSGAGGDFGENGVGDCTPRRSKRNRIDELGEKGVDSVKKQKVKGGVVGGKVLVVARVLRSRSTLKPESEETVEKGQKTGGFEGEQTGEEDGSDKKRATMKEEGGKHVGEETVEKGQSNDGFVEEKTAKTGGSEKKRVATKEEDNDHLNGQDGGKVQVVGRVLRSRSALKSTGEETVEKGQSTGDFVGENTGEKDESEEKIAMKEEEEDGVHLDGEDSFQSGDMTSDKLVRKRGRPRKTPASEILKQDDADKGYIDQHAVKKNCKKLKRKRGRPPKPKENDESAKNRGNERYKQHKTGSENLKRGRGRPPKVQKDESWKKLGDAVEKGMGLSVCQDSHQSNDEEFKKLKPRRGRPPKIQESQLFEKKNALSEKRFIGKEYGRNTMPAKKMKFNKDKDTGKTKQDAGELGHHSRKERQAVRDKIVDLLLGAGWEIQYRPREGREYKDAVYVNPEGRTHWSVTLAYRMLKKQYEDDGTNSKACKSNFKFTPIPDEELNVLTKVMSKVRSDKNKKKKKRRNQREKGENLIEVITTKKKWKLQRRKLGAAGVGRKLLKGRAKPKSLHNKNDESAFASDRGTAVPVRGRKRLEMQGRKRCGLMVRSSQEGTESDSNGYVLYTGKRTVLSWMLGLGTVLVDEKVQYLKCRKTRGALKGRITSDGILCDCCNKTFTIAEFEIHAGGKSSLPFKNILLDSGSSLLQCQLDSWHKQDESARKGFHFVDIEGEDPNDDTCGVCGDGGDLICCDSCPSTFHQSCLEIKKFPSGRWHCVFCLCKLCGETGVSTWQRDDNNAALLGALLTCCLCEEKYHRLCVQPKEAMNDDDPGSSSFCGKKCQELYEKLQKLFGVKHELEEGFSWTFVRRFDVGLDISLRGMPRKIECNSKVAVALLLMDECFLPMVDQRSGVNLIRNIVYNFGSNFNRLNYSGFFTAILERGDEMIAAASIRIHGNHLAEMPFIGTRYMYRRQGMCRRLLSAIEMGLSSLDVEKLVIPAISELRETWTSVFGFKPLEGSSRQVLSNVNMMVFPGVDMLQKTLLKHHFAVESMNLMEESTELGEHTKEDVENKSDECCSAEFGLKDSSGVGSCYSVNNKIKELAAVETGSLIPDVCLNDTYDATIQIANTLACPNSGMTSNDLGDRNKSIASPLDLSCDGCERSGSEMKNNIADKYLTGFELKASCDTGVLHASTAICESAEAESGSLVPDGCLNNRSDIIIQDVHSSKYHAHSDVFSENMDVRNENTENPRDFPCDSHEQTGNEMIPKSEEKDLARIVLHSSSKTNASDFSKIIGETSAPELGLLYDGCLNAASDPTTHTKCHDHSGVGSGNLDGKMQNIVNPLVSSCDTWEKAAKSTGQKSALSATSDLPTDNALPQFPVQLNQHNLSEVENKPCAASHIMSGVATCGAGMPCASSDRIVAASCEVKIEDNDVKQNLKNTGKDYMHVITEGVSIQSQDLIFENGKVSDGDIVQHKSSTCNNSCNVQSTSPTACQKLQDASKGHFAALPAEQNCGHSKTNGPTCNHLCHAAAFDTTVKPTFQTSVRVCDLKEVSAAAISNGISLDEGVVSDGAYVNAALSKLPGPDSEVDNDAEQL